LISPENGDTVYVKKSRIKMFSRSQKSIDCCDYHVLGNGRKVNKIVFINPMEEHHVKAALELKLRLEYIAKYGLKIDYSHFNWMEQLCEITSGMYMGLDTYVRLEKLGMGIKGTVMKKKRVTSGVSKKRASSSSFGSRESDNYSSSFGSRESDNYSRDRRESDNYSRDRRESDNYSRDRRESDNYSRDRRENDNYSRDRRESHNYSRDRVGCKR
jgi:hypothetical protein